MNSSAVSPRAALVARARKHFVAIAAAGAVLTGGLGAYVATTSSSSAQPTTGTGTSDPTSSGSSQSSGLSAPDHGSQPDASSNAS